MTRQTGLTPKLRRAPLLAHVLLAGGLLSLSSCRYTTFPIVPQTLPGEFPARLTQGSLKREGGDLSLQVRLDTRSKSGFLGVVWFREDTEIGRDQTYLDAREPQGAFTYEAPEKGNYRAVVTFEGSVLRQFELEEVPITPPAAAPASPAPAANPAPAAPSPASPAPANPGPTTPPPQDQPPGKGK